MRVVVSIVALGSVRYALAAREALASALQHTKFDVYLLCDRETVGFFAPHPRMHILLHTPAGERVRSSNFLAKFEALARCLDESGADFIIHLDADAVFRQAVDAAGITTALQGADLAMVEQPRIRGSTVSRAELRQHYVDHAHAFLVPDLSLPAPETFLFVNSGVILFRREGLSRFLDWASELASARPAAHRHGQHMIADQDYLQVWVNTIAPTAFNVVPWIWNHCEHWDEDFPNNSALIIHLSNFCNGPTPDTVIKLRAMRRATVPELGVDRSEMARVTFVVVSYNSAEWLDACLEAAASLGPIIVVDNGSGDPSASIARRWGARLVQNAHNRGFAAAANAGARAASTPLLCFLNPDCLVTPSVVDEAERSLAIRPDQILVPDFVDWSGRRQSGRQSGYTRLKILADLLETRAPRLARRLRASRKLDDPTWYWPLGACVFVDKDVFLGLGGFDESYFCYMEDVELGHAAYRADIAVHSLPQTIVHLGQQGAKVRPADRQTMVTAARLAYAHRHYGHGFALLVEAVAESASATRKLFASLRRRLSTARS
ncbi:MAG: glycosyltransferase family 2 protein [Labrys sp. (in: a-proteobacteria)]